MYKQAALILVDIQTDFCSGGALAVSLGDEVVEVVNQLMPHFPLVVATQDWHPPNHISFQEQGGIWTPHCIQNTPGAELHYGIDRQKIDSHFRKAFTPEVDAYSGFEGINHQGKSLHQALKEQGISTIFITGLATDYCVKATTLDALKHGYEVCVVTDAVRAVNVNEGDGEKALMEMHEQGARLIYNRQLIYQPSFRESIFDSTINR